MTDPVVPRQQKGGSSDNLISITCNTEVEARRIYDEAKRKLFDINNWNEYAGRMLADFTLCDENGAPVDSGVLAGQYIRIDIPGPGSSAGAGYDWVKIEKTGVEALPSKSLAFIRVRPASSPVNEDQDVAHFFSGEATSSFIIRREKFTVIAEIHGRNEIPNIHTEKTVDSIRNRLAAKMAIGAFSDIQWKQLIKGWLS